jgi:RNA polymerase sigma-70 factor (ECF subfamily)
MAYTKFPAATIAELVMEAQAGDRNALEMLYEMYWTRLTNWLYRNAGRRYDAENMAQEIFMKVLEKLGTLENPAAFEGWLYTIAKRKFINDVRGHARPDALMTDRPADIPTAPEILLAQEERSHVRNTVEQLGPVDRDTLRRFYFAGESLAVIASQVEAPVGTVKRRLHVARKRLAVLLKN